MAGGVRQAMGRGGGGGLLGGFWSSEFCVFFLQGSFFF